jgi:hypothetical protein
MNLLLKENPPTLSPGANMPSLSWLAGQINDKTLIARTRNAFESLIRLWRQARNKTKAPAKVTDPILEKCPA